MDAKKIRKSISRFFGWVVLIICSLIVRVIPAHCLYGFAKGIGFLGYWFVVKLRRIALENLNIAFGQDKLPQEKEKIAKACFTFMAKSAIELLFLTERPNLLKKRIEIEGGKNLDNALSRGKGVILVSAHFGNFPLLIARLALAGYSVSGIMRRMRDERVEKFFFAKRDRFKIKTIYAQPRNTCVSSIIEVLRNNGIVFILLDQNFGTGGIFVDFFGQKAATATGPVILAQRTKALLLPCFIIRQEDDTHKIIFEPALQLEEAVNSEETVFINIQKLTNIIESYIRKYPAEWGWIHRRWKSQEKKEG
ncbi:MAG: lysophospholipid acyltransferase family protein [Candidatus Omnitrophota bacterium]|nr:lysophospholipid acyltransferase family protein [Candidatus Omnitrophota bacterium]